MLDRTKKSLAAPVFDGDEEKTRQARLLNTVLLTFMVPLLAYAAAAVALPNAVVAWTVVALILILDLAAWWLLRRGQVRLAGQVFTLSVWAFLSVIGIFFGGLDTPAIFGYSVGVLIAGLLLGSRGAFLFAGATIATLLAIGWADAQGLLPPPAGENTPLATGLVAGLFAVLAAVLLRTATTSIDEALSRARSTARELENQRSQLESTVAERTRDLSQRNLSLEATAEVARDAAQVLDVGKLLSQTVALISDRFGFYHCGIFILDPSRRWAVLQAASSEGGRRMLARGHRLQVADVPEGVVGYAMAHGEPRIALDVGADVVYFNNPDLPETRSEMALPLRARGELIGALDVQSTQPRAFSDEDIAVLQTLADQVAVAISNARLFQQAQEGLEAERRAYVEASWQGWIEMLRTRSTLGFSYSEQGVSRVSGGAASPSLPTDAEPSKDGGLPTLALPILHRGQTLGTIEAHKPAGSMWTPAETALMQTLADQLSVALESARLYEESRERAAREQAVRHITEQMRRALEVEAILQATVAEVGQSLGVPRAYVRLGTTVPPPPSSGGESDRSPEQGSGGPARPRPTDAGPIVEGDGRHERTA